MVGCNRTPQISGTSSCDFNGVSFVDINTGIIVGNLDDYSDIIILRTTNGGTTWSRVNNEITNFLHSGLASRIYIMG